MPLVRIDLRTGKHPEHHLAIGDAVHQAMVETINVPALDRFQVIREHDASGLIYDAEYLGIHRDDDVVFIQITLNSGRSVDLKKRLYARIVELLEQRLGVRRANVLVSLVEVPKENWSFGDGLAQYAS